MLHAVLHGKLGLDTPDVQRLEDALTSTVFGTLLFVERWDVIASWLDIGSVSPSAGGRMWFWPVLRTSDRTAIPDVCVRIGNRLLVIEAKFHSARNDLAHAEGAEPHVFDQLVGQYACIAAPAMHRLGCPDDLERAFQECDVRQAYLVDAARVVRARLELKQSREREPRMRISTRPVTWQALDRRLFELRSSERWVADLRAFLEIQGLSAFVGFRDAVTPTVRTMTWRRPSGRRPGVGVVASVQGLSAATLRSLDWRASRAVRVQGRWQWRLQPDASAVTRAWRFPPNTERNHSGRHF